MIVLISIALVLVTMSKSLDPQDHLESGRLQQSKGGGVCQPYGQAYCPPRHRCCYNLSQPRPGVRQIRHQILPIVTYRKVLKFIIDHHKQTFPHDRPEQCQPTGMLLVQMMIY
jgi:hypothetical protein